MGCQSGTTQRLAHHQIRSIGLDADGVFALGLGVLPTSSTGRLVRRHCVCPVWRRPVKHETNPLILNNNKQSVFGTCHVVTAGSCLFVSWHTPSSGGGETGERQDLLVCLSMSSHDTAKGEQRGAQKRKVEEAVEAGPLILHRPHNMSVARHGCAHMRLSGRQAIKTTVLVARQPHPNMGSIHVPAQHH